MDQEVAHAQWIVHSALYIKVDTQEQKEIHIACCQIYTVYIKIYQGKQNVRVHPDVHWHLIIIMIPDCNESAREDGLLMICQVRTVEALV